MTEQIRQDNAYILKCLSFYINECADFITPQMIHATVRDCGCDVVGAYRILIAGALDLYDNRRLMNGYIRQMFSLLDADIYRADPYYQTINLSEIREQGWQIRKMSYRPYEAFVFNDLRHLPDGRILPQIGFFDQEYTYPCILQDGREWMLITPNEIETMKRPIADACGRVVTYGLGLGYFAFMAAQKSEVSELTVVERNPAVISLFRRCILPQFPCNEKIRIVQADALEYAAHECDADFVFADIWHDPSDGIPLYLALKKLERPACTYSYWIEDTMKYYLS